MLKNFLLVFVISSTAYSTTFDLKKQINIDITHFEVNSTKSKGEICDNLDSPDWDKHPETQENVLRFGPHVFFDQLNKGVIKETGTSTGCEYGTDTIFKDMQIHKTINQKCKNEKDSVFTEYKVNFKKNEIVIQYAQKKDKEEKKSTCYLKLAKGKK